jgi:hypothetical protein
MKKASDFPSSAALSKGLARALAGVGERGDLTVLTRTPINMGTFPSEVVEYRRGERAKARVFCKYGADSNNFSHGHRGGPAYEVEVYRRLLRHCDLSLPAFRGSYRDAASNVIWLVLGFLPDTLRLDVAHDPLDAMTKASNWSGRFHAACEARLRRKPTPRLSRYDADYYTGWVQRADEFAGPLHEQFPWFKRLVGEFGRMTELLLTAPQTVIHGEYYPKNILLHVNDVFPVDWESAAVAPGEIDLASLTEGWTRKIGRQCEQSYQRARWQGPPPHDFTRTLAAARVYLHFRWLGDYAELTARKTSLWHFKELRKLGLELGLIS